MEFRLRALTPVWTGGIVRNDNSSLHLTGIKGSIRWWYEVLIRGFSNYACDPTSNGHCELNLKELNRDRPLAPQIKKQICPSCYMFGCTGWSGKFILRLNEPETDRPIESISIHDAAFKLLFPELKKLEPEEKLLLKMTLKLIVDYGAIGAKTIFKPSEKKEKKNKLHHRDFGILARDKQSNLPTKKIGTWEVIQYLERFEKELKKNKPEWPSMECFWFVKGKYIDRFQHNRLVNRDTNGNYIDSADENDVFLGGFISREKSKLDKKIQVKYKDVNAASKKIFSFIGTDDKNCLIKRCFGYIKSDDSLDDFIEKLDLSKLPFQKDDIISGSDLIRDL